MENSLSISTGVINTSIDLDMDQMSSSMAPNIGRPQIFSTTNPGSSAKRPTSLPHPALLHSLNSGSIALTNISGGNRPLPFSFPNNVPGSIMSGAFGNCKTSTPFRSGGRGSKQLTAALLQKADVDMQTSIITPSDRDRKSSLSSSPSSSSSSPSKEKKYVFFWGRTSPCFARIVADNQGESVLVQPLRPNPLDPKLLIPWEGHLWMAKKSKLLPVQLKVQPGGLQLYDPNDIIKKYIDSFSRLAGSRIFTYPPSHGSMLNGAGPNEMGPPVCSEDIKADHKIRYMNKLPSGLRGDLDKSRANQPYLGIGVGALARAHSDQSHISLDDNWDVLSLESSDKDDISALSMDLSLFPQLDDVENAPVSVSVSVSGDVEPGPPSFPVEIGVPPEKAKQHIPRPIVEAVPTPSTQALSTHEDFIETQVETIACRIVTPADPVSGDQMVGGRISHLQNSLPLSATPADFLQLVNVMTAVYRQVVVDSPVPAAESEQGGSVIDGHPPSLLSPPAVAVARVTPGVPDRTIVGGLHETPLPSATSSALVLAPQAVVATTPRIRDSSPIIMSESVVNSSFRPKIVSTPDDDYFVDPSTKSHNASVEDKDPREIAEETLVLEPSEVHRSSSPSPESQSAPEGTRALEDVIENDMELEVSGANTKRAEESHAVARSNERISSSNEGDKGMAKKTRKRRLNELASLDLTRSASAAIRRRSASPPVRRAKAAARASTSTGYVNRDAFLGSWPSSKQSAASGHWKI